MKLLTIILFLTSFSAISQTLGKGLVTKTTYVDVTCTGRHYARSIHEEYNIKAKSEILFWGEGKIRIKLSLFDLYKNNYSFSYLGIDNGFGEYTLYEKPSDINQSNPTSMSLQLFPETATLEVRDEVQINKMPIKSSKLGIWSFVSDDNDTFNLYCKLAPNVDLSFDIDNEKSSLGNL